MLQNLNIYEVDCHINQETEVGSLLSGGDAHSVQLQILRLTRANTVISRGVLGGVLRYVLFFFFAVPSSVLTSEVLLPRRSSRHPPPSATPRAHSASWPRPQRRRQIVGRLPSKGNTVLLLSHFGGVQ